MKDRSEEAGEAEGYIKQKDKVENFVRGQCKTKDSWTFVLQDKKISGLEKDRLGQNFGWASGSKGKGGNVKQKCYFSLVP